MKLKFAIVGCGRIGGRHAAHIDKHGELTAVCDIVPQKARTLSSRYGANVYIDIEEMLATERDLNVVAICSPNGLHAKQTISALEAGFHVLCEKPMALNSHDCGEMIKAAYGANKNLFIVKQNRYNPPVVAVKELIDHGKLGEIFSVQLSCFWNRDPEYYHNSWKGSSELDGGTLFTQFSHFIDLLYWMIGDIKEVHGFAANFAHNHVIDFEDTGVIAVRFHNGTLGTINYSVNSYERNMEGSLTIFGEKGTIKIGGQYLNELEYQNIKDYIIEGLPKGNPPNNYGYYQGSMSNHHKVYENIVDVLQGNGVIATNGFEGMKTIEIIENIYAEIRKQWFIPKEKLLS